MGKDEFPIEKLPLEKWDIEIDREPLPKCNEDEEVLHSESIQQKTLDTIFMTAQKEECAVSDIPIISLTRQQIYDEIWTISVAGMAKKYDIPYSQLMLQIKAAQIPIPPSGYWTRLSFGKEAIKPELSEPFDELVQIQSTIKTVKLQKTESATLTSSVSGLTNINVQNENNSVAITSKTETPLIIDAKNDDQVIEDVNVIQRYGRTYNVYDRVALYKEVWGKPVTEVAKRYNVSDVAIHKVCKALDIPTPPLGYWAKLRAGKPVFVKPLPPSNRPTKKTGMQTSIPCQPASDTKSFDYLSEEDRALIIAVASQIGIPDATAKMHTKIIAHRKTISEWRRQKKVSQVRGGNRRNDEKTPYLANGISDDSLSRVCHIIDALIKAMEPLGCSLTNDLGFTISGETVRLSFSESQDKVPHIPTKEENMQMLRYEEDRKKQRWASMPQIRKYDYVYNGLISVVIEGRKSFRDCKSYIVEDRLGDIMLAMYENAGDQKRACKAREEAERIRQEEERRKEERRKRYNTEVERTLALKNLADDYDIACKIRNYILVVSAKDSLSTEELEWIQWAKEKADWYDPTIAKKDDYLGQREHSQSEEKKKLQYKGYWW